MARKALSQKTRFEVFKRDSFTCQYCGATAPTIALQVDHIEPVAKGGSNEIINLITSCFSCNSGKGDRALSDESVAKKQIQQLKELNERKEQLEMMAKWRNEMASLDEQKVIAIADAIDKEMAPANRVITDTYRKEIKAWLKKYTLQEIWEAIEKSSVQYLKDPHDPAQRENFLTKIPKICHWSKREKEDPAEAEILKMLGLANKLWYNCNRRTLYGELRRLHDREDVPMSELRSAVVSATGIMKFNDYIKEYFESEAENG